VFTEESSQQLTPLPEEPGEAPQAAPHTAVQPPIAPFWMPWVDVAIAAAVWVGSVVLLLLVPVVYALPYIIYRIVKLGPPTPQALATDKTLIFFSVAGVLPTHMLTFVLVWIVVTYAGRRPFLKNIQFEWPEGMGRITTTLVCILLASLLFGLALAVTAWYGERKTDLDILIESSIYTRVATAFVAVVSAPLIEELVYRGILYRALEKAAGVAVAINVVALLFAGVHVFQYRNNLAVIVVITMLSITLTVTRAATGKVLPSFIIHLVFNGIQSVIIVVSGFVGKTP
jgi:membrane protease YdiL (CAAX protease family)